MEGKATPGADGTTDTKLAEGEGEVPADGGFLFFFFDEIVPRTQRL